MTLYVGKIGLRSWRWNGRRKHAGLVVMCLLACGATLFAGGPKYVAGGSFFDPAVVGQPIHWAGGVVRYFVDQGPLNGSVSNTQATAMVDAAAALWSVVPTAGVSLENAGSLAEDVSGGNIEAEDGVMVAPMDVIASAAGFPVGVIFDADGSVIDTVFGKGASDATSCENNAVSTWIDSIRTDATIAHAVILLNGLCATTPDQLEMMSFQLERAFGEVLGLGFSQVNPQAFASGDPNQTLGLPVMQPLSGACGAAGGACVPQPGVLRFDDIAALNRMYPITAANLASFPGKELTAAHTLSIMGTLSFEAGAGMQGVNVVARPLDMNGSPLYQYAVTFVSGGYFNGDHGNPVTGWTNASGDPRTKWGSEDPSLQGYFDLSAMPLPPGMTAANYEITFEPVNPLYMLQNTVGPYLDGSPTPSGTMPIVSVPGMAAGSSASLKVMIADSANGDSEDAIASETSPRTLAPSGQWSGRIGQTDWFVFPVRAGRTFTVVTQALNEAGEASENKALPVLGVWSTRNAAGSAPMVGSPGMNGSAAGESFVSATAPADEVVRLGVGDERGDGRPDYAYAGWVLYVDTVAPTRLPMTGGPIVIHGMGFRPVDTVLVGGQAAVVTSISPNEMTAIAPAAGNGLSGSVDVEVDDLPIYSAFASIAGGISYDAGTGDSLKLDTAPANTVPMGVPLPFTVTALGADLSPAGGVTVVYSVISGSAMLGCGQMHCAVTATGDGIAAMTVAAVSSAAAVVAASLANGASVEAHFTGGTSPGLSALTPTLSVAAGATVNWTTGALVENNGAPMSGQAVTWQIGNGIAIEGNTTSVSDGSGVAAKMLTVGPLAEGQQTISSACVNGTLQCASFTVLGARPEFAFLQSVSGTEQSFGVGSSPGQIVLRVRDMNGNPMAGGTVTLSQALYAWAPPCPPHGRCAASALLATQAATAVSAIDGSVVFTPVSLPGVPTNLLGVASTGNTSSLSFAIEQHP